MSDKSITCDQAIFTSLRTPTGEGYRIIAASAGLKVDERREITRNSPSHGALCRPIEPSASTEQASVQTESAVEPGYAVAFYPLSSGRFSVGLSLPAGAEHTGRGGDRVYTHVVVFDAPAFARSGYSPFVIAQSMIDSGLSEPQLKPPSKLETVELTLPDSPQAWRPDFGAICDTHQVEVLTQLLENRILVVHAPDRWIEAAEAFWLGIPGPLRGKLSMSAGLKFATSRSYHLQLIADDKGAAKSRTSGAQARYVDTLVEAPRTSSVADVESAWVRFVQREWMHGDWVGLASRTSLPFADVGPMGRQRVGHLYNTLDELPNNDSMKLLAIAAEHLERTPECPVEKGIVTELIGAIQHTLLSRLGTISWPADEPLWGGIVSLWRLHELETGFADPLVAAALRAVSTVDPFGAAEAALSVAGDPPAGCDVEMLQTAIVEALARWAEAVDRLASGPPLDSDGASDPRIVRSRVLADRWTMHRPDCEIVKRASDRCDQLLVQGCATTD